MSWYKYYVVKVVENVIYMDDIYWQIRKKDMLSPDYQEKVKRRIETERKAMNEYIKRSWRLTNKKQEWKDE